MLNHIEINKSFIINPPEGGELITEAFGIDGGYENHIANLKIDLNADIIYITGESGSGKSTILNEIAKMEPLEIPKKPLFQWGNNTQETLRILSLVGLGDAILFLSYYENLSDSQKARARMALELLHDNNLIIIDEFLSTLDRKTAKAVAFCFQKALRKMGRRAILVTAHDDLTDYLQPKMIIKGNAFPSRWVVSDLEFKNHNPILDSMEFKYVDKHFYKNLRLGELHYKGKYTGGTKEYLAAILNDECIGILVSTYRMHDGGRRISRVVIHPSYRGCGIGVAITKEYLKLYPNADVIAAMAMFNPVFEKAGMVRVDDVKINPPTGLKQALPLDVSKWHSKSYCDEFMTSFSKREILSKFSKNASHLVCPGGKYLDEEEIKNKIINEPQTAGRVLWGLRPRTMAKFIGEK